MWDIDGNEYVDYHNGYGVMVMGHAHPKIVEAVQRRVALGTHFAQPTEDALPVAENLAERTGLPYWRFGNSGTEATLDAVRIMRATTGRDLILKIEGTYHGHHDALMVSVFPPEDEAGPREHPNSVAQSKGLIPGVLDTVVNVPFNDAEAAERAFAEHEGQIAGMIVEPVMSNCGVVVPEDGYLARLKESATPTGRCSPSTRSRPGSPSAGRRDRGLWRTARPRGVRQGDGRRPSVRRDRRHRRGHGHGPQRRPRSGGHLQRQPAHDGRGQGQSHRGAHEGRLRAPGIEINVILRGCERVIEDYRLPASMKTLSAKGSIDWRREPIREYRDLWKIDDRVPQLAWLWQLNGGVFKSPGSKWESWTTSIVMSDDDAGRYVENFDSFAQAITA